VGGCAKLPGPTHLYRDAPLDFISLLYLLQYSSTDTRFQARNFMRDDMKKGDLVFFYHSNCDVPGIYGLAVVEREGYPDHFAWDKGHPYYGMDLPCPIMPDRVEAGFKCGEL
jgi:EVE domain-containing protein